MITFQQNTARIKPKMTEASASVCLILATALDCGGALRRIECDGPLLKSVKFTYILRAKIHEHPSVM